MFSAIYTHTASSPWRVSFNTSPSDPNWDTPGIAFYAYTDQTDVDGLIPVYSGYAEHPWRHTFSTSPVNTQGWTSEGVTFYAFNQQIDGTIPFYLKFNDGTKAGILTTDPNDGNSKGYNLVGTLFYAIPPDAIIEYEIVDIEYNTDWEKQPKTADFVDSRILENPSRNAILKQPVQFQKKTQNTFSWSLNESLKVGWKAKFKGGVPFIGESEIELSVEFNFGSTQTWTDSTEYTVSITDEITLNPGDSVTVEAWIDFLSNVSSDFKVKVKARATSKGYTESPISLTGEQVASLFKLQNPGLKKIEVTGTDRDSADIIFPGKFKGNFGLHIRTLIKEIETP